MEYLAQRGSRVVGNGRVEEERLNMFWVLTCLTFSKEMCGTALVGGGACKGWRDVIRQMGTGALLLEGWMKKASKQNGS
jgi:hypothetical protein